MCQVVDVLDVVVRLVLTLRLFPRLSRVDALQDAQPPACENCQRALDRCVSRPKESPESTSNPPELRQLELQLLKRLVARNILHSVPFLPLRTTGNAVDTCALRCMICEDAEAKSLIGTAAATTECRTRFFSLIVASSHHKEKQLMDSRDFYIKLGKRVCGGRPPCAGGLPVLLRLKQYTVTEGKRR